MMVSLNRWYPNEPQTRCSVKKMISRFVRKPDDDKQESLAIYLKGFGCCVVHAIDILKDK